MPRLARRRTSSCPHPRPTRHRLVAATLGMALAFLALPSAGAWLATDARVATPTPSPLADAAGLVRGSSGVTALLAFFCVVWALWLAKFALASRCRPFSDREGGAPTFRTTVIAPVYREPEDLFGRVLESVRANEPSELVVVVDGGDPDLERLASDYADRVISIPKAGKRHAIAAGLSAADPTCEIVVVLDSDTVWEPGMLDELILAFADPRVGGVTPRQAVFDRRRNWVRRAADWIEDIRYSLTVPAQSVLGQVGCLAGRTVAYRREAFVPAVARMLDQRVLGLEMSIGDDRVLTNELLEGGWRTVYQPTARVVTDAPNRWSHFLRQQLRWGRSSQRETILSLRWLWRRPFTFVCFTSEIAIPFALWGLACSSIASMLAGDGRPTPLLGAVLLSYAGMLLSLGVRQAPHFRRHPADILLFPVFALALTVVMAPLRIVALATMFRNDWGTRDQARGASAPAVRIPRPRRNLTRVACGVAVVAALGCVTGAQAAYVTRGEVGAGTRPVFTASAPSAWPRLAGVTADPWHSDEWQRAVGVRPDLVMIFRAWSRTTPLREMLREAARRNLIYMLTWEPWEPVRRTSPEPVARQPRFSNRAIAAGRQDAYIRSVAREVREHRRTVVIRYAHEMTGEWYPWHHSPSDYKAAWRHIRRVFADEGATNVVWVWSVNSNIREPASGWWKKINAYYPGDAWVDVVGTTTVRSALKPFSVTQFGRRLSALRAFGKPVWMTEVAAATGHRRFLRDLRAFVRANRWVRAVVWSSPTSIPAPRTEKARLLGEVFASLERG